VIKLIVVKRYALALWLIGQHKFGIAKMGTAAQKIAFQSPQMGTDGLTSSQTAQYTHDLLDSLGKIAACQKQPMLARLLEAAAIEAGRLAGQDAAARG
jgi:hypothetical protein